MSNKPPTDLQQKIIDHLKGETIGLLLEEDDIREMSRKAIEQALFANRTQTIGEGYNKKEVPRPSVVVEAAIDAAKKLADVVVADAVKHVVSQPSFADAVMNAITEQMRNAIIRLSTDAVHNIVNRSVSASMDTLVDGIRGNTDNPHTWKVPQEVWARLR